MSTDLSKTFIAPPETYRKRRAKLAAALDRLLVVFSGHAPARNYSSNAHVYRPNSTYMYFGGPPLEHAALLIEPDSDGESGVYLFRRPTTTDDALWMGERPSDAEMAAAGGLKADSFKPSDSLEETLRGRSAAGVIAPYPKTIAWAARTSIEPASEEVQRAIVDLRNIKDEHELKAMRRSNEIAIEAHQAAMRATAPGRGEADAAAAFMQVLYKHQSTPSFSPIITVRGEILHSEGHGGVMRAGDLLVCDAGAEGPGYYASDITRTWPVDGKFDSVQRLLYEHVERALNAAAAACTPGTRYRDVHDLAARILCEGLVEAELLTGEPETLVERKAHTLFFPHGVGHLIGLDVHDMEDFGDVAGYAPGRTRRPGFGDKFLRLDRDLAANMCMTIEPGIYFVPAIWACKEMVEPLADVVRLSIVESLLERGFGGIRIEHSIRVRETGGPELLSAALPTGATEMEDAIGG